MEIKIIDEFGYSAALYGIGLSRGLTSNVSYSEFLTNKSNLHDRISKLALSLSKKDGGHNKFLESIFMWLEIRAPRYWWQQFDTYRIGVTKQSESTMYTLIKRELIEEDFSVPIGKKYLKLINKEIKNKNFDLVKSMLPEGYLQKRIVCIDYKALKNVVGQRRNHRLKEWNEFIDYIFSNAARAEFL